MTVKQLIEKLKEFPENMPVATINYINPEDIDDPEWIRVSMATWVHSNYPYNKPDFDYVNLE